MATKHLLLQLKNPSLLSACITSASSAAPNFAVHDSGRRAFSPSPVDDVLARVEDQDESSWEHSIDKAHRAFPSYAHLTGHERSRMLRRLADAQRKNAEDLSVILACEAGKPIKEARAEIEYGAGYLEWFAEEAKRTYGTVIPSPWENRDMYAFREPVGVAALITPFNFPNAMLARKVAPALAVGCTVLVRPSEDTPLSAIALAHLASTIFPPGVFNLITTSSAHVKKLGEKLCHDERVAKLSFTGSTPVGKDLLKQASQTVKRCSMELGGNAPFIVFKDANLNHAAASLMMAKFRYAGQTCIAANRILVHRDVHDKFVRLVQDKINTEIKHGPALDETSSFCGVIHARSEDRIRRLVRESGFTDPSLTEKIKPILLTGVKDDSPLFTNEVFGPVVSVGEPFASEEEVFTRANSTRAGLASYAFSESDAMLTRTRKALQFGIIGLNAGAVSSEVAPFGGCKESGFGREGSLYGIDDYTQLKYVCKGTV